jgi:hypothetical protein
MNHYTVSISANIPYPWQRLYRYEASNEGVAASRALKEFRNDLRQARGKSKRIHDFTVNIRMFTHDD